LGGLQAWERLHLHLQPAKAEVVTGDGILGVRALLLVTLMVALCPEKSRLDY
jgi:hypothetical protein